MIHKSYMLIRLKMRNCRQIVTDTLLREMKENFSMLSEKSTRMKQFHEKLKLQPIPKIGPQERFLDVVLVTTDSRTGELIANSEKDPTKWGDWQNAGRVSDF